MRIAQVAPISERVPPVGYGAVEPLVSWLTDELVRRGHEVTLFASGDSQTLARLHSVCPRAVNQPPAAKEPELLRALQVEEVRRRAAEFDLIHCHLHSGYGSLAVAQLAGLSTPVLYSLHSAFTTESRQFFSAFPDELYVSVSDGYRQSGPDLPYVGTIHHGLPAEIFPFSDTAESPPYLVFLGRLRPEKGTHLALEVARRTGLRLLLAGRVKPADQRYFAERIEPWLDGERIRFLGELGFADKVRLLGGAAALLFPITEPEPFGLVMVESMLCGTPVLSSSLGAVHEVLRHGETGFICPSVDSMVEAVARLGELSRAACRRHAAERFHVERMVSGYERIYERAEALRRERLRDALPGLTPLCRGEALRGSQVEPWAVHRPDADPPGGGELPENLAYRSCGAPTFKETEKMPLDDIGSRAEQGLPRAGGALWQEPAGGGDPQP
jgi:glycosyltransferase involved in cell wall biosynthesis